MIYIFHDDSSAFSFFFCFFLLLLLLFLLLLVATVVLVPVWNTLWRIIMPYLWSLFDINKNLTFIFSNLKNRTDTSSIGGTMKTQGPCEPVWPSGKALGWQVGSSIDSASALPPLHLFEKVVVCGHCLVTLSLTINETLKRLSFVPVLMQKSFWWWQCSNNYIISLFPTSIPPPPHTHTHTPSPRP